jgi:hypothetical protein
MIVAVFFPSLMGVGIIVSGALLVSDWLRRLLPHGGLRRHHDVVVGTYGTIGGAVNAAGYRLAEPWFLERGVRRRSTYVMLGAGLLLAGVATMWAGIQLYTDPLGFFFDNRWVVGIGYAVGGVLVLDATLCLTIALMHRSLPRGLHRLVATTSLGRIVLPTDADRAAALDNIAKEA